MILQNLAIQNVDLFLLGISSAAIVVIGFIIYTSNPKSITNKTFLALALAATLYGVVNYFSTQANLPTLALWLLRLVIFFAVWYAYFVFQLFYVFPKSTVTFSRTYKFVLLPLVTITAFLNLSPFVFKDIARFSPEGQIAQVTNGPGIALFGVVVTGLILSALFLLVRKMLRAKNREKVQIAFIFIGSLLTFSLLIIFNFIFPALLDDARFVPFGAVFLLPFAAFTAYAIIKHQLLDIKVITTEILAFVLAIVTLFEILLSQDLGALLIRISVFILVLTFSILLIRSVRKEVQQREELQILTEELESANIQLKRLDKAKSEFISIASHQLRTPLTAIKGYMSLVREGTYGKLSEKLKKPIENVYASNERLIHLVNDLLSLSRIESGKIKMEWEQVQLEKTIESVIDELQVKADAKNLQLIYDKPTEKLPELRLDEAKIRNIILNFIDNAIRYTDKGSITVHTVLMPNKLLISFVDTGAGMNETELGRLFESFTRGSAGAKSWTGGSGLGLYIAKQFAEMHNGRVWAESGGKGKGSAFYVELPVHTATTEH